MKIKTHLTKFNGFCKELTQKGCWSFFFKTRVTLTKSLKVLSGKQEEKKIELENSWKW